MSDMTDHDSAVRAEHYASQSEAFAPAAEPFAPQAGIGVSLSVGVFGFSVIMLGLASARVFNPAASGIFVPVALGLGATGLIFGGVFEMRANNVFAGTFSLLYAGFLIATGLILRTFSPDIIKAAGAAGFGDAFGSWLLLWCVFTAGLTYAAYYVNMPAFLAFALLAVAYLLLGLANIGNPGGTVDFLSKAGGWVLIADGLAAWYLSWGLAVNSVVGDRIPLYPYPYSAAQAQEAPADVSPLPAA
jgi:succinate-acetate transporter protein